MNIVRILRAIALLGVVTAAVAYKIGHAPILAASAAGAGETASPATIAAGTAIFQNNCVMCHGAKMEGHPPTFPSLVGKGRVLSTQQLSDLVHKGKGNMPGFASRLSDSDIASLLAYLANDPTFTPPASPAAAPATTASQAPAAPAAAMGVHITTGPGNSIYQQNCAFCHGRDAGGGESGPDLTRSKLVSEDVSGDKIGPVVRNGRAEGKMPKFNFSDSEMTNLVLFIHAQAKLAASRPGGRRGVDVADLQTGNAAAGKQYFDGAGGCSRCHSSTGDLAGVASRYEGLQLEEQMLYPKNAKDKLTVTLPSGETATGVLAYQDEFTVAMRDATGTYRSWPVIGIKFTVDSPVTAHVDQFPKYTDDDIHNLMAYIQTLK